MFQKHKWKGFPNCNDFMSYLFLHMHTLKYHVYTSCTIKLCCILFSPLILGPILHSNTETVLEVNDQSALRPVHLISQIYEKQLSKIHCCFNSLLHMQSVHQTTKWSNLWSWVLNLVMKPLACCHVSWCTLITWLKCSRSCTMAKYLALA